MDERSSSFLSFPSIHVMFADSKLASRERGKLCFKATRCRTEEGKASNTCAYTQTFTALDSEIQNNKQIAFNVQDDVHKLQITFTR